MGAFRRAQLHNPGGEKHHSAVACRGRQAVATAGRTSKGSVIACHIRYKDVKAKRHRFSEASQKREVLFNSQKAFSFGFSLGSLALSLKCFQNYVKSLIVVGLWHISVIPGWTFDNKPFHQDFGKDHVRNT